MIPCEKDLLDFTIKSLREGGNEKWAAVVENLNEPQYTRIGILCECGEWIFALQIEPTIFMLLNHPVGVNSIYDLIYVEEQVLWGTPNLVKTGEYLSLGFKSLYFQHHNKFKDFEPILQSHGIEWVIEDDEEYLEDGDPREFEILLQPRHSVEGIVGELVQAGAEQIQ